MSGGASFDRNDTPPEHNLFRDQHRDYGAVSDSRLTALLAQHRLWLYRAEHERVWPKPETARLYCQAVIEDLETEIAERTLGGKAVAS